MEFNVESTVQRSHDRNFKVGKMAHSLCTFIYEFVATLRYMIAINLSLRQLAGEGCCSAMNKLAKRIWSTDAVCITYLQKKYPW